jgi:hypothetical protein
VRNWGCQSSASEYPLRNKGDKRREVCSVYRAASHSAQRPGWLDLIPWKVVTLARSTPVTGSVS